MLGTRRVLAVLLIGLAALVAGYGLGRTLDGPSQARVEPIELEGPAPLPNDPGPSSTVPPATVVPPPTVPPSTTIAPAPTPPPPPPTSDDDDDGDDDGGDDDDDD